MLKFCGRDFKYMTENYKLIQITNNSIGDVGVGNAIPLGVVNRRLNTTAMSCNTFNLTSSDSDQVIVNDVGFYKITYSLTATAAAAGVVTVELTVNGTTIYSVSQTIVDETTGVNLTLPFVIRVFPNSSSVSTNVPATIQFINSGVALTGSS